jgi:plastocyanin
MIVRGGTYTYIFKTAGTYTFNIAEEPELKGTVIVTP